MMRQAIYIGHQSELKGKVADVLPSICGGISAKFLEATLPPEAPGEWNQYSRAEFHIAHDVGWGVSN